MALTPKDLQNFKEQLEKEAGEIEAQVKTAGKSANFGDDVESDFSEEADEAEEFAKNAGVSEVLKNRLADIDHALDKIMSGKYGICEKCKKEIPIALLKVDPESRFCKVCKAEQKDSEAA